MWTIKVTPQGGGRSVVSITTPKGEDRWFFHRWARDAMVFAVGHAECLYDQGKKVEVAVPTGKRSNISNALEYKQLYSSVTTEKSPYQCWDDFLL